MPTQIDWTAISNVAVTGIAAIIAYTNYRAFVKFSDITQDSTLQNMMLTKAKECNQEYDKANKIRFSFIPTPLEETSYSGVITEMIITMQLLDNSLGTLVYKKKSIKKKREFFLLQFWIQLNTDIRELIKRKDANGIQLQPQSILFRHFTSVITTFKPFFENY